MRLCALPARIVRLSGTEGGVFGRSVETGTLLEPFLRLDDAVAVQVGAEVAVAADGTPGIEDEQAADEGTQRGALCPGAGVGRSAVGQQAALVGDAYRAGIVASGVGADAVERAHGVGVSVAGDVVVITAAVEASAAVEAVEVRGRKDTVTTRSGAVYHNQVDGAGSSHVHGQAVRMGNRKRLLSRKSAGA